MIKKFQALYNKEIESMNLVINGYNYKIIMQDLPLHDGTNTLTSTFNEDKLEIIISRNCISCSYAMYSLLYEILYLILTRNQVSTIEGKTIKDVLVPQLTLGLYAFLTTNFTDIVIEDDYSFDKCSFILNSDKLNIGGFIYKIIYTNEDLVNKFTGEKCYGVTYSLEQEIHVSNQYAEQLVNITLIHEILHAIIHSRNIEMEIEEEENLVECLSHELNTFLKCNKIVISK